MRKLLFASVAGLFCICTSCNDAKTDTANNNGNDTEEQKNLAASQTITKAFQTGDVSGIDSVVADDFLDHTDRGDFKGRDSLKSMVNFVHANFKDMKTETVREVTDGDYVWSWMRYTGTSDGSMGMPKGPYDMQVVELGKYKNGKAIEHWSFMEMQDMMAMMPQQPMNNMNNMDHMKSDSSKMNK
jgi:predicted SnoaL-like aldol condensation-catalyzing enzyme